MAKLDNSILKEYDIRGRVPQHLNEEKVSLLAKGFASFFLHKNIKKISLSYDNRTHSKTFAEIIIKELNEAGINIVNFGLNSTGMHYFSLFKKDLSGGIMITASHLEKEFNGFKISINKQTIFGKQIQEIMHLIEEQDFFWLESDSDIKGTTEEFNIALEYLAFIKSNIQIKKPLKVAVDCANGTSSLVAEKLFSSFGCKIIPLYCESDGNYPNHEADPTKIENMGELIDIVLKEKCDIGISFDGDADRLGVIDNKGNLLHGDKLLALFSKEILTHSPEAKIVFDVKCSKALEEFISDNGGIPIMHKTGHSLIKEKLMQENALLGGEMSGHFFFNDKWFGFDDGIYAGCRILELLSNSKKSLYELQKEVPDYINTPEIRVAIREEEKFEFIEKIKNELLQEFDAVTIDGIRVTFPSGWALVRASNTSSNLILRFEADSEEHLEEIKSIIREKMRSINHHLKLDF